MDFSPQPTGEFTTYATLWNPNVSRGDSWTVNGHTVLTEISQFVPSQAQMLGEIHTYASQMPGDTSTHEVWKNAQIWYPGGSEGSWHTYDGHPSATANSDDDFAFSPSNPTGTLDIWDTACS